MSDSSLSIDYTIASITNTSDGFSTIAWSLTHVDTGLNESRTGDKFKTEDITNGISTTDDDNPTKIDKLKTNFETKALPYFQAFAKRVRLAQGQSDIALLDDIDDSVSGLSVMDINFSGSVTID